MAQQTKSPSARRDTHTPRRPLRTLTEQELAQVHGGAAMQLKRMMDKRSQMFD